MIVIQLNHDKNKKWAAIWPQGLTHLLGPPIDLLLEEKVKEGGG